MKVRTLKKYRCFGCKFQTDKPHSAEIHSEKNLVKWAFAKNQYGRTHFISQ